MSFLEKYLSVFKISFKQEFVFRLNFIVWRIRNILQIFTLFFLWDTIFFQPERSIFGYDRAKILTYIFGLIIVRAIVFSARAVDVAGEIGRGDLSNYLIKPVNYFGYWFTRDISSKTLNLLFAFFEVIFLFTLLKPPFYLQREPFFILGFLVSLFLAVFIHFTLLFITSFVSFWMPSASWGTQFLVNMIIVEFLSGGLFPLDILPRTIQAVLSYTPFPYLIFFPIQVYLGKVGTQDILKGVFISFVWSFILHRFLKYVWNKGLLAYQAFGR